MPIKYQDTERHVMDEAREAAFVNFVTGIWPGAASGIDGAELNKETTDGLTIVTFTVFGRITVDNVGDLPNAPFQLRDIEQDGDYVYDHVETVTLTPGQISAFASFLSITWTGSVADVDRVSFKRVAANEGGLDIMARITGSKTVATAAGLPPPPVRILEIT